MKDGPGTHGDADQLVHQLIQRYAQALKELNCHAPMSRARRAALEEDLGVKTRPGRRPSAAVAAREMEIARRMRNHYNALADGSATAGITSFAASLVAEFKARGRTYALGDIFGIYRRRRFDLLQE